MTVTLNGNGGVRVLRDPAEIKQFAGAWDKLATHPNADRRVFDLVIEASDGESKPVIIASLDSTGAAKALIIARQETTAVPFQVAYTSLFRLKITSVNIIYGGILGHMTCPDAKAFLRAIDEDISRRRVSLVKFSPLNIENPLYQLLRSNLSLLRRQWTVDAYRHFAFDLPSDFDVFFKGLSSKHRSSIRRYRRKFESEMADSITTIVEAGRNGVQELCADIEEVAATTYQRGLGKGFIHNEWWEKRLTIEAERDALRSFIMYAGTRPQAFWIFFIKDNIAHSIVTGYKPIAAPFSPGTLLLIDAVEALTQEQVHAIDWGLGYADYKERFSTREWLEAEISFAPPNLRGVAINSTRSSSILLNKLLKAAVRQFGMLAEVKKRFRQRLRPKSNTT